MKKPSLRNCNGVVRNKRAGGEERRRMVFKPMIAVLHPKVWSMRRKFSLPIVTTWSHIASSLIASKAGYYLLRDCFPQPLGGEWRNSPSLIFKLSSPRVCLTHWRPPSWVKVLPPPLDHFSVKNEYDRIMALQAGDGDGEGVRPTPFYFADDAA